MNQTYPSIEFIIVDDKGNDDSMSIVRNLIENHYRQDDIFIIEHEKNKGLSAARNTGISYAHGDYIFFMDSDDTIIEDCIKLHYETIVDENADFTVANIKIIGSNSIHIRNINFKEKKGEDIIYSFLYKKWSESACNKLYKRSFISDNSFTFINDLIHEDLIWSYLTASKASKIVAIHEETYIYQIRDNSITTKINSTKKIDSLIFIINAIDNYSESIYSDKNIINAHGFYLDFLRLNTSLLLLNSNLNSTERKNYYNKINSRKDRKYKYKNPYSFIIKMPYGLFSTVLKLPYFIYKKW